jgi:hypothetical protein
MKYYVSCKFATFYVEVNDNSVIIDVAPIGRKFLKKPFAELITHFKFDKIHILQE